MKTLTSTKARLLACLMPFLAAPASATLITFDDLEPYHWLVSESEMSFNEAVELGYVQPTPLTNQYEHLGVSFGEGDPAQIAEQEFGNWGAAISTDDEAVVSGPNAIASYYEPGSFQFRFVGDELPDYVSFYVTARPGPMSASVTGADGSSQRTQLGYYIEDEEIFFTETPTRKKVEFFGEDLESVYVGSLYGHRSTPVFLDNLYFGAVPVPEPASMPMLLAILAGLMFRRRFSLLAGRNRTARNPSRQ